MATANVRITGIKIRNFKNVISGDITCDNSKKKYQASVLGVYGQNGSGKTALIDAITLLKYLLSGKSVPQEFVDYINIDTDHAVFSFDFIINSSKGLVPVSYEFTIKSVAQEFLLDIEDNDNNGRKLIVLKEVLRTKRWNDDTHSLSTSGEIIDTESADGFAPKSKRDLLVGNIDSADLSVIKKLAWEKSMSFIFSGKLLYTIQNRYEEITNEKEEYEYYWSILKALSIFARRELFVLDAKTSGLINLNAQPILFRYNQQGMGASGAITLPISHPTVIPQRVKEIVIKIIEDMNTVLFQIIPNLRITLKELGTQLMDDGSVGERIQLMSLRANKSKPLPLANESEGIKKIISVLQLLIVVYNDPSITLAVDELDSGIFEYLLGELVNIISERGKGQLIFTSHNLRVLETIDSGFVAFTTIDPYNRYTRLKCIKDTNNLRDVYYRKIMLGNDCPLLYDVTNNAEIALAFKMAGMGGFENGKKDSFFDC